VIQSTALVSAHHNSVGVHDCDEAVSNGQHCAVNEPLSQCVLDDGISPAEYEVGIGGAGSLEIHILKHQPPFQQPSIFSHVI